MIITLLRHGRPVADYDTRIAGPGFDAWLTAYDAADIDASLPPPRELREALAGCGLVVTSPLHRSVRSAGMLELRVRTVVMEDAGEAPLPRRIFCPLPVKPLTLTVMTRILWTMGMTGGGESRREAIARARRFAASLAALAGETGHVAVVGHGYFNRFAAAALREAGWVHASGGRGYWSFCQLRKPKEGGPSSP